MNFNTLPLLETERLLLRPVTLNDVSDLFSYASDPELTLYLPWPAHKSKEDSRQIIEEWLLAYQTNQPAPWGIIDRSTKKLIGTIGFVAYKPDDYRAELGYALSRIYWGQGFMLEAARTVIEYGFEHGLNRIYAFADPNNKRSQRVLEKVGMVCEGTLRECVFQKGQFCDQKLYSILKREWKL